MLLFLSSVNGLISIALVLSFPECYINQVWLLSLNLMLLRFIHIVLYISIIFLFIAEWYSIVWKYENLFIISLVGGPVGCFQFLLIKNKLAVNICVQVFAWIQAYLFLLSFTLLPFPDIVGVFFCFFTNWRFVATLHQASLSVLFFQQYLLTWCFFVTSW